MDEQDDTIVSQIESKPTKEADGIYIQVGIKKDDIEEFFKILKKLGGIVKMIFSYSTRVGAI